MTEKTLTPNNTSTTSHASHASHAANNRDNLSTELPLPNEEQKPALKETQSSFWVTASAGSGKTMLLTQRFLALLLSGAAPERILCLTYTRAAAAEMSVRILQALHECSEETKAREIYKAFFDKQPNNEEILRATALYTNSLDCRGGLRIMTFHAFCQSVLGQFPLESGVSPKFRLAQQGRREQLKSERPFEAPESTEPLTQEKLNHINATMKNDRCLELAADVAQHYRSAKKITLMRAQLAKFFQVSGQTFQPCKKETLLEKSAIKIDQLESIKELLLALPELSSQDAKRLQKIQNFLQSHQQAEKEDLAELYLDVFLNSNRTLGARGLFTKATTEKLGEDNANLLQLEAARLAEAYSHYYREQIAYLNLALYDLAQMRTQALEENKKRKAQLDFDDLIDKTEELFSSELTPWVLYKLDGSFDHVLIDEAQDTNSAQWNIVEKLTEEIFSNQALTPQEKRIPRSLFVVGDEKQSIYSFQGANLERFIEAREKFRARATFAQLPFHEKTLSYSYRSLAPVLKAVDQTFAHSNMLEALQATDQRSPDFVAQKKPLLHRAHRQQQGGKVSLHCLDLENTTLQKNEQKNEQLGVSANNTEAKKNLWAERITDFVQENILGAQTPKQSDTASSTRVQPGDVMILLRKREHMQSLINLFTEKGLPCEEIDKFKLVDTIEAEDMLAWIRYLVQPEDELNLASLLKSPFLNVSEELLQELCLARLAEKNNLRAQLRLSQNSQLRKCSQWLDKSQALARKLSPLETLRLLLDSPCPTANSGNAALIQAHSSAARDPIVNLCEAALEFEKNNSGISLAQFLQHIESLDIEITRESLARPKNKLRLMTIHGAKGLEAPIVVLPLMKAKSQNKENLKLKISEENDSLSIYLPKKAVEVLENTKLGKVLKEQRQKQIDDAEKEEKRLLYVAMTRARDQLVVLAPQLELTEKGKPKAENPWSEIIRNTAKSQNWLVKEEKNDQHYTLVATAEEATVAQGSAAEATVAQGTVAEVSSEHTQSSTDNSLGKTDSLAEKVSPLSPPLSQPPLPSFLFSTAPAEQPPAQTRAASKLVPHSARSSDELSDEQPEEQSSAKLTPRKRGLLIHQLVQKLAQAEDNSAQKSLARAWLAQALKSFKQTELERKNALEEWSEKAERLIDNSHFFSKPLTTRFETEILGNYNGLEIIGRIDYLQENNNSILFGDLKTDLSISQTLPQAYASQMGAYLALLQKIYPHKNITAYILWFENAEIQKLGAKELPKPISTLDERQTISNHAKGQILS